MQLQFRTADEEYRLEVKIQGERYTVQLAGQELPLEILTADPGEVDLRLDGRRRRLLVAAQGDERFVFLDGRVFQFRLVTEGEEAEEEVDLLGPNVCAQMPGTVVKLLVAPGQEIAEGAGLLILESMKMETEIAAPVAGTVVAVHVQDGQTVGMGDLLVDLDPAASED